MGSNGGNGSRNAIIGVCTAFGGFAVVVLVWWCVRAYRTWQERGHIRLSTTASAGRGSRNSVPLGGRSPRATTGGRSRGAPSVMQLTSNGIERPVATPAVEDRRSFFFAEDELRGYEDGMREEEMVYVHRQPSSGRRVPITPGAISAPILRESSLNW